MELFNLKDVAYFVVQTSGIFSDYLISYTALPEGDHVSGELTMDGVGSRGTPLQVDGGGGGVVSCQYCRLPTWLWKNI